MKGQQRLVGRTEELQWLRGVVAEAAAGTPQVVVLSGQPGVGASRLAAEALDLAAERGFACHGGRAAALTRELPLVPLLQALADWLRALPAGERSELVGDLPQLGTVISGLGLPEPVALADPSLERTRLTDGIVRLIERLARRGPLALLIDEMHQADATTLEVLAHLVGSISDLPILVVGSCHPAEPNRPGPTALAAGLAGPGWAVHQREMAPLGAADTVALLGSLLGGRPARELRALALDRCGGRPRYVQALAGALHDSGRLRVVADTVELRGDDVPLPSSVEAAIRTRLAALDAPATRALEVLALAGEAVGHEVVTEAAGLSRAEGLDALDILERRGLARRVPGGTYELVHGLLRETVLSGLSATAAQRGHARLLPILAARQPGSLHLARHVTGAGDLLDDEQGLVHLLQGAERARALGAASEATRYLTEAITRARRCGRRALLPGLLLRLGKLLAWQGSIAAARGAWDEALAAAEAEEDEAVAVEVGAALAMLEWSEGRVDTARARVEALAGRDLGSRGGEVLAPLLLTQTVAAGRIGELDTATAAVARLDELLAGHASPADRARALVAHSVVDFHRTDYVVMAERLTEAVRLAEQAGEESLLADATDRLSVAFAAQGDYDALRKSSEAGIELARRTVGRSVEPWPRVRVAFADLLQGRWDEALRGTSEALALARRWSLRRRSVAVAAFHAWVLVHLGRLPEARALLAEATSESRFETDRNLGSSLALAAAALALAEGDVARACENGAALEDLGAGWIPLHAAAVAAEAKARAGDRDAALAIAAQVRAVRSCVTELPAVLATWITGLCGEPAGSRRAAAQFGDAADGFAALGMPLQEAVARLEDAHVRRRQQLAGAAEQARQALASFEQLGAPLQAQRARQVLRELGETPSRGRRRRSTGTPFSPRELEVARLVAEGLTNAEVAERLFVSPRTVTTHLGNIYGRLGISSRVALTRYLADSGWLTGASASER